MSDGLAELRETPVQTGALAPFDRVLRVDATSMGEFIEGTTIRLRTRAGQAPANMFGDLLVPSGWAAPPLLQPFYPHWQEHDWCGTTFNYSTSNVARIVGANTGPATMVNPDPQAMTAYAMGRYCSAIIALNDPRSHAAELCRDIGERVGRLAHTFVITGATGSSDLVNTTVMESLIAATAPMIRRALAVDDPLPQLEETRQQCLAILSRAEDSLRRDIVESIKRQLSTLLDAEEWDTRDRVPSVTSFGHLMAFLARHNELAAPALTVSNEANFVASYLKTRENIARLEFYADGWAKWLVYLAPIAGRSEKGTAIVPVDKIKKALEPFGVWDWMSQR